jgi:ADP-ribose pyrophosphatase YjhB (NUDIX family)
MNLWQVAKLAPFVLDPKGRARLRGARVEVCVYLASRDPARLLLVKSQYGPWMPVQEGVRIDESFDQAAWRGLSEEVDLDFVLDDRGRLVNDQGYSYLGARRLPEGRWDRDTRDVAPGSPDGHPLKLVKMRRKAYWAVFRQVACCEDFRPEPNGTEVVDAEWLTFSKARERITQTVAPDKVELLLKGLDRSEQAASGTVLHVPNFPE